MSKIRLKRYRAGFTIISNKMLQDKNLSLKAKGLMCQMYSYPDSWDFSVEGLIACVKEGESAIRAALAELEEAKYLRRTKIRDEKGQYNDVLYELFPEIPSEDNPSVENPLVDNQGQINKNETKEELNTKEDTLLTESTEENPPEEEPKPEPVKAKKPRKVFVKPTVEEVRAYCLERKNGISAETWIAYYESNGWMVGRNPMKDWKATVRYWESKDKEKAKRNGKKVTNPYYDPNEASELNF